MNHDRGDSGLTDGGSFCWITSSGFSNMLKERRHCLRGRVKGFPFVCLRIAFGEPAPLPPRPDLKRGPRKFELLRTRSRCGDSSNISPNVIDSLPPLPNLNSGSLLSGAGLGNPSCAECAFERASDGRKRPERLRLHIVNANPSSLIIVPADSYSRGVNGVVALSIGEPTGGLEEIVMELSRVGVSRASSTENGCL